MYKREAGAALLEALLKKISQMKRDGLSEKLILPELERAYGTNFKALVGALWHHTNEKGRMVMGWKTRKLNTNPADGTKKPDMPPEKQGKMVDENASNAQKVGLDAPPNAPDHSSSITNCPLRGPSKP